jgi:hypothetical protein
VDVYKVGVSLVLTNGVSSALAVITKDLLGLRGNIGEIQKGFQGWKPAILGAAAVLGGTMMLGVMKELAEKAADFQDALTKVSQLNPKVASLVQSGAIQKQSYQLGQQLGMKVEDITGMYGGIYGVIQDPKEAQELLPYASRYARLMQLRHPDSHPEQSINTLMRAGELAGRLTDDKGKIDPEKVKEWFDMAAIAEASSHGQVNAQTLMQLGQQGGGIALRGLSKEGYEHMMIMSQMMGGARAGTSLLSLRQQMTGTMFKRNAEALQQYGLLHPDEWTSDHGRVIMTDAGAKRMTALVKDDPIKFADTVMKALEAKGINDKDGQMIALSRILGRQTTQRFVSDMMLARQQIDRDTKGLEQGATVDQGLKGFSQNVNANLTAMHSAWHNLMVAIGGANGENFVKILQGITSALNTATSFANAHPQAVSEVMKSIAALAVGLTALGAAAIVVGLAPLVGAGGLIAGVVAALGALIALNWHSIVSMFDGIKNAIAAFVGEIASLYDKVKGIFGNIGKAFKDLGNPEFNGSAAPMAFHPGERPMRAQPISLNLNVDGRTLAQAISDQLAQLYDYPTGSPDGNDASRWSAGSDHSDDI